MEQYTGKSIFKKMAIGKIFYYEKNQTAVKREKVEDVEAEVKRFDSARETAKEQLQRLFEKAQREVGETEAAIFEVHMMMMDDGDYLDSVYNIIRTQETCAEYATAVTGDNFAAMFAAMDDEYMKARAADVKDISERIVNVLSGNGQDVTEMEEPVILVADDLAPSETVQMDKSKLLGFVTRYGSANSHTAILARTMNIPALIEVDIQKDWNGKMAVIDGYEGTVTIDPDEEYLNKAKAIQQEELKKQELLKEMKGKETVTKGGKENPSLCKYRQCLRYSGGTYE